MNLLHFGRLTILFAGLLALSTTIHAATYLVKPDRTGDYATIQAAINASASGDTICLADGTFLGVGNKDLDPGGRNLVFKPADGAGPVIDCENSGRAFHIHSGEDASTIIRGLRLTNGLPPGGATAKGGAILVEGASPTIVDNTIDNNEAGDGGGMYLDNSGSLIIRNQILDNDVDWGGLPGAGLLVMNSTLSMIGNHVQGNGWFDAITIVSSTVTIEGNTFYDNGWVDTGYSDINADSSDVTIIGNRIEAAGGCVELNHSTALVRANHFVGGYRLVRGGGVYAINSDVVVEYNYFNGVGDGAVDWHSSTGSITRNVIAHCPIRSLDWGARAINIDDGTQPPIAFNTFYENGITETPGEPSASDVHIDAGAALIDGCLFVNSVRVNQPVICGAPPWASPERSPAAIWNRHWGNLDPIIIYPCGNTSITIGPMLCDPVNENFFATALPDSNLLGALPPGCATSDVLSTNVPPDDSLWASNLPDCIVLTGFSFENLSDFAAPVNYRLLVEGPGQLDDNGDPASLVGSTPVLAPGQTWVPPDAKLCFDDGTFSGVVRVRYVTAYAPALQIPDTNETTFWVTDDVTTVRPTGEGYRNVLEQSFPNPANPSATIAFSLAGRSEVELVLYDVRGRLVTTLARGLYPAGRHTVGWTGVDARGHHAASGIYFYRITAGDFAATRKLILLK